MSWSEDLMARKGLTRCALCPGTHAVIGCDGPVTADILFVGDKPGKEENNRGRPFIGQTGKELNEHYLPLAGYTRDSVRFTNTTKCYHELPSDSDKSIAIAHACARHHLRREILEQRPRIVVPMGANACSMVDGLILEMQHGIPMEDVEWFGHTMTIFPTWHPAWGLRQTETMKPLRDDFMALGQYARGEYVPIVDEFGKDVDYRDLTTPKEVDKILDKYPDDAMMARDTETDPDEGFWCQTFSLEPGTGYMVRRSSETALKRFAQRVSSRGGKFIYQNGMFDLPVEGSVGMEFPHSDKPFWMRFDDTMVRSYHLQNLPQALKHMAYRLCGMKMEEFEDVVMPYSVDVILEFFMKLSDVQWPKPEAQMVPDPKNPGQLKKYQAQGLNTKIKRLLTDFEKKPVNKTFGRWNEWSWEERTPAIERFGMMPKPSIKYVPLSKALWYACRDADATLRVWYVLDRLKRTVRRSC